MGISKSIYIYIPTWKVCKGISNLYMDENLSTLLHFALEFASALWIEHHRAGGYSFRYLSMDLSCDHGKPTM